MTNEEKIFSMLEKIQADVTSIKDNGNNKSKSSESKMRGRNALLAMSKLLTDEEKEEMGRYWDAEEKMKEKRVEYMNKLWKAEQEKPEARYA